MTESQVANEWIAKGELKDRRQMLLRLFNKRFPGAVTTAVTKFVSEQESLELLCSWFDAGIDAATFEDFMVVLKQ